MKISLKKAMPPTKTYNQCPKCVYVGIEMRRDLIDWVTTSPLRMRNPRRFGTCPNGARKREQHGKGKCCCMFGKSQRNELKFELFFISSQCLQLKQEFIPFGDKIPFQRRHLVQLLKSHSR